MRVVVLLLLAGSMTCPLIDVVILPHKIDALQERDAHVRVARVGEILVTRKQLVQRLFFKGDPPKKEVPSRYGTVSYTHLTLPTIYSV